VNSGRAGREDALVTRVAAAFAILMRRTLTRTKTSIFMNLRRVVPQLALSKRV
jgi:hypothetical protein